MPINSNPGTITNFGQQAEGVEKTHNNTNTRQEALVGYGADYGSKEARLALAIADAGSAGGGSGLTQAQAEAAFTAALQAQAQTEFQDILLEDANGVLYIATRTINEETGAVTFTSRLPDGTAHTPVAPSTAPKTVTLVDMRPFWANVASTGVSIGDKVIRTTLSNGTTSWFNSTTGAAVTAPPAANLVASVERCVIEGTFTTLPALTDNPNAAQTGFVDSAFPAIPLIDGKRANTLYLYRISSPVASPLYPGEIGFLMGSYANSGFRVPLAHGNVNRPAQANIIGVGGFVRIHNEISQLFVRNFNVGTTTLGYRYSYQTNESDDPEFGKDAGPQTYRVATAQNAITGLTTQNLAAGVDVTKISFDVHCAVLTAPTTFTINAFKNFNGVNYPIPIGNLTLPAGTNVVGSLQFDYTSRSITYNITVTSGPTPTFSYQIVLN